MAKSEVVLKKAVALVRAAHKLLEQAEDLAACVEGANDSATTETTDAWADEIDDLIDQMGDE